MNPQNRYFDQKGNPFEIGKEFKRGGEGTIYSVNGQSQLLAKIYNIRPSAAKRAKIEAMVQVRNESIALQSAWPNAALYERLHGELAGLLMPRINTEEYVVIQEFINPSSRASNLPGRDWRFLIATALNVAFAFRTVHGQGHVIGDVNSLNILVSKQSGLVKFIDCDSFQIRGSNGERFSCDVGTPEFTPPELQKALLTGSVRTLDHDSFGLAVCIFQLLFMGRHPYAGIEEKWRIAKHGEASTPSDAIQRHLYAYGQTATEIGISLPSIAPPATIVTPGLLRCFERAFSKEHIGKRPADNDWIRELQDLTVKVQRCLSNAAHYYLNSLTSCPWCSLERSHGIKLFEGIGIAPFQSKAADSSSFDLILVWPKIEGAASQITLPPLNSLPKPSATPTPTAKAVRSQMWRYRCGGTVVGVVFGLISWLLLDLASIGAVSSAVVTAFFFVLGPWKSQYSDLKSAGSKTDSEWRSFEKEWTSFNDNDPVKQKLESARSLRRELEQLPSHMSQKVKEYEVERERRERAKYLATKRIVDGNITGIGFQRSYTLQMHGIVSAADVSYTKILGVPGFGETMATRIMEWRKLVESQFRLGKPTIQDQAALDQIERNMLSWRTSIEAQLSRTPQEMQILVIQRSELKSKLMIRASDLLVLKAQNMANLKGR